MNKRYIIITADCTEKLEDAVNNKLNDGWEIHGNLVWSHPTECMQVMINNRADDIYQDTPDGSWILGEK